MTSRSPAELEDKLDQALAWRKIELSALEAEVRRLARSSPDAPLTRALTRSGVALAYAHWEGYLKEICQHYLDYVSVRRLRYSELSDSLALTALQDLLGKVGAGDEAATLALLEIVRTPDTARARIPRRNVVQSKSNLRYQVLVEIFARLGLPVQFFETKENFIDKSLCDARNEVAHGRDHYPDPTGFGKTVEDVVVMLDHARDLVVEHVRTTGYRHKPTEP